MSHTTHTEAANNDDKTQFGFWIYLMTDCVAFATLFATYAVLRHATAGGPTGGELFSLPYILLETILLLTSSFTAGLVMLAARQKDTAKTVLWLFVTMFLGMAFLTMELTEFSKLVHDGASWHTAGYWSAYFTLVGTHGAHIAIGLIWASVLAWRLLTHDFEAGSLRRLGLFSMFWHFLDIVWIFIFSFVYLLGVL